MVRRKGNQFAEEKSPCLKVQFWKLTEAGYQRIGAIVLRGGRVVAEPAATQALMNVLAEPIHVLIKEENVQRLVYAHQEPELFVRYLPRAYHGGYFRAGDVKEMKSPIKRRKA